MKNRGFEKSRGNLIASLDDDTVPAENWLETFIKEISKYNADGVSGNYNEEDPFLREIRARRGFPKEIQINPGGYFGIGGNVMYKRACLEECLRRDGYIWNPHFRIGEDVELASRLKVYEFKLVLVLNDVIHMKRTSVNQYFRFQFTRGGGIYDLYEFSKINPKRSGLGRSLLWSDNKNSFNLIKWINIFLKRIMGPFDYKSFSSKKYFIVFWAGEKFKSLGFAFQMLFRKKTIK